MKKVYIGFSILIVVLVGSLVWAGYTGTKADSFSEQDENRPIAEVKDMSYDIGEMSVDDIKGYEFEITNKGKSDLLLTQISTSCDCTYAYVIQGGKQSEEKFTMVGSRSYKATVAPNETVKIKTVYEPSIMPVDGPVTRYVNVATNDPNNARLQFKLSAFVKK